MVLHRYQKRVLQAVTIAEEFVFVDHDYSADETFSTAAETYVSNAEELRERWRRRIKAVTLIELAYGRELNDIQVQLSSRYRRIARQAEEMTEERWCEAYLGSLASIYDPHSAYLSPTVLRSFYGGLIREYSLGLALRQKRGQFVVEGAMPRWRLPHAYRSILGWNLIAIRRENGTILDVVEMHGHDLYQLIRSPMGPLEQDTVVILELMNPVTWERRAIACARYSRVVRQEM